jgi:hypothetical protein
MLGFRKVQSSGVDLRSHSNHEIEMANERPNERPNEKSQTIFRPIFAVLAKSALVIMLSVSAQLSWGSTHPNSSLTPGTLCNSNDPDFTNFDYPEQIPRCGRNIAIDEKRTVAAAYGNIPESEWINYEFDHLIPLCAGGSNRPTNLWPQPLSEAHIKDKLENEICIAMKLGKMTQAQAVQKVYAWFNSLL